MNTYRALIVALLLVAVCVVLAGCTTSPGTGTPTPTATATVTATPTPTVTQTATATTIQTTAVTTVATTAPTATGTSGPAVTVDLVAHNIAFDKSTISVPACADVTVNFKNEDTGIPHNFAVYDSSAATTKIFSGQIITGPSSIVYHFTAPCTPGDYYFRCDVHPSIMYGKFVVTPT